MPLGPLCFAIVGLGEMLLAGSASAEGEKHAAHHHADLRPLPEGVSPPS